MFDPDGRIRVNWDLCTNCGKCVPACPSKALQKECAFLAEMRNSENVNVIIKSVDGYRWMFLSTAWYNWAVAGVFGLAYRLLFPALGVTPMPDSPLYFHLFLAAVALFGYIYYRVSRDLTQMLLVQMGAIGKLLVFGIVLAYWVVGVASWHLMALGSVDLVYAILFVDFLRSSNTRRVLT